MSDTRRDTVSGVYPDSLAGADAAATVLVIGQSHTEAIASAVRKFKYSGFDVFNFNAAEREKSIAEKIRDGSIPNVGGYAVVCSMVGGNFHNTFGLIENSIHWDMMYPGCEQTIQDGRQLVTYGLAHAYFHDKLNRGFLKNIRALRDLCHGTFAHCCSPPPISDDQHILDNPGKYFADKIALGIVPRHLRLSLYRLHSEIVRDFCKRENVMFIPPPPEAVTPEGFLGRQYWKLDPTHANADYGRLVLHQVRALLPG